MGMKEALTKIRTLGWLSYQVEANWTNVGIYLAYISIRPTFTLMMMVFIYIAVSAIRGPNLEFGYFILIGQAFYNLIGHGIMGIAFTLWDDREHYRVLKYIYVSPLKLSVYLVGRSSYYYLEGIIPLLIAFFVGSLLINYPIFELKTNWIVLILNFLIGIIWITAFGLLVASFIFFTTHYGWIVVESILSSLLLFGGVLFSPEILPYPLNLISNFLPIKYWLDINRIAIKGVEINYIFQDLIFILFLSLTYLILASFLFSLAEKIAKKKGIIDMTTAH